VAPPGIPCRRLQLPVPYEGIAASSVESIVKDDGHLLWQPFTLDRHRSLEILQLQVTEDSHQPAWMDVRIFKRLPLVVLRWTVRHLIEVIADIPEM
jgi:hypothetical protein